MTPAGRARAVLPVAAIFAAVICGAGAVERLDLEIEALEGDLWHAGPAAVTVETSPEGALSLTLDAGNLHLPEPLSFLRAIRLRCERLSLSETGADCAGAIATVPLPNAPDLTLRGDLALHLDEQSTRLSARQVAFAGGTMGLDAGIGTNELRLDLDARGLDARALPAALAGIEVSGGTLDLSATLRGTVDRFSGHARIGVRELDFASPDGRREGQKVTVSVAGDVSVKDHVWRLRGVRAELASGLLYVEPLVLDVSGAPLSASGDLSWHTKTSRVSVDRLHVEQPGVLSLRGEAAIAGDDLHLARLRLVLDRAPLSALYQRYLRPMAARWDLDSLATDGEVAGRVDWRRGEPSTGHVALHDVTIEDRAAGAEQDGESAPRRFGFYGVNGAIHWGTGAAIPDTELGWGGGYLYRIDVGPAKLRGQLQERSFTLAGPLEIPLLDGEVVVEALEVTGLGQSDLGWRFQGRVREMSMDRLSAAFDWPALGGRISGMVPSMRYAAGEVVMDGALLMEVFDGRVVIHDLHLHEPLGRLPRLGADIDFYDISLDALTRAFSFGTIRGRLGGHVHDLVLVDWKPESFDAEFVTPENDDSEHRISQRAIDALMALGGAPGGQVLSTTFLRYFEEFSYDRLGLKCRLTRGVCEMDGFAPAERGYFIVKGGGWFPRIDVVGYNKRVEWPTLLEHLKTARHLDPAKVRIE